MTKRELIDFVKAEITASGALKLDQLNDKEIERIIDNETIFVHREWRDTGMFAGVNPGALPLLTPRYVVDKVEG